MPDTLQQNNTQDINHQVTVILLKKIIELLGVRDEPIESVSVDNLDVVSASLRNELSKVVKALPDNKDLLKELKSLKEAISKLEMCPTINVAASKVEVPTITIPEISVPEAKITVNVPDVIVPEIIVPTPLVTVNTQAPIVNVPEVDLSAIIRALEVNLNKLRTNSETRPLAVRMSDGTKWIKEMQKAVEQQKTMVQALSDVTYLKSADGSRINPATSEGQRQTDLTVPYHNQQVIDESLSPATTTITYKLNGVTVGTKTISVSGSVTTITVS